MTATTIKQIEGESAKAYQALQDYLGLGSKRSFKALLQHYKIQKDQNSDFEIPSNNIGSIKRWSARYKWAERIEKLEKEITPLSNPEQQEQSDDSSLINPEQALTSPQTSSNAQDTQSVNANTNAASITNSDRPQPDPQTEPKSNPQTDLETDPETEPKPTGDRSPSTAKATGDRSQEFIQRRQENESLKAYQAYQDFRDMGEMRSIYKLNDEYKRRKEIGDPRMIPTTNIGSVKRWCRQFNWKERVKEYDKTIQENYIQATSLALSDEIKQDASEKAKAQIENMLRFKQNLSVLGESGMSIAANIAIITNRVTTQIAEKDGSISKTDLNTLSQCSAAYRSYFVQGAPVSIEAIAKSLGLDQIFREYLKNDVS